MSWFADDVTHGPGVQSSASSTSGGGSNGSLSSPASVINTAKEYADEVYDRQIDNDDVSRSWAASENQKNRDFQQYNSDTSYQRAVKDMIAAGLNPVLALKYGGSSTPSGSSISPSYSSAASSAGSVFSSLFSSGLSLLGTILKNESQESQTEAKIQSQEKIAQWNNQTSITTTEMRTQSSELIASMNIGNQKWQTLTKAEQAKELAKLENQLEDQLKSKYPSNAWSAIWPEAKDYLERFLNRSDSVTSEAARDTVNWIQLSFEGFENNITPTTLQDITEIYPDVDHSVCIATWKEALEKYPNGDQTMSYYEKLMSNKGYTANRG